MALRRGPGELKSPASVVIRNPTICDVEAHPRAGEAMYMDFKFVVGQKVLYRPTGQRPALFKVMKQMPEEPGFSTNIRYRIKNDVEGFERIVNEIDLHILAENDSNEADRVFPRKL
jgi:hypothetical protein